jgi:hypothetical protein
MFSAISPRTLLRFEATEDNKIGGRPLAGQAAIDACSWIMMLPLRLPLGRAVSRGAIDGKVKRRIRRWSLSSEAKLVSDVLLVHAGPVALRRQSRFNLHFAGEI